MASNTDTGNYIPELKKRYDDVVVAGMLKRFNYENCMQVPKLEKIVLNMGIGEAVQNSKVLEHAIEDMTIIAGQKPILTRAKKSVAAFKLRAGMPIGCKVTLRGRNMYDFFYRLINLALPRVRDFRGLSPKSFDGYGNYNMGLREQVVFPEIDYDKIDKLRGFEITITTTAKTDNEGMELLKLFGLPLRKN